MKITENVFDEDYKYLMRRLFGKEGDHLGRRFTFLEKKAMLSQGEKSKSPRSPKKSSGNNNDDNSSDSKSSKGSDDKSDGGVLNEE
mmetsp:Transcript_31953/g.31217  ORF Transcript_31953/g.31217 Transcript_31953/m.31217 type:complete len:86 (-) Transcript_31953:1357-1614(-)